MVRAAALAMCVTTWVVILPLSLAALMTGEPMLSSRVSRACLKAPSPRPGTFARNAIYTYVMARCVRMALLWLSLFALPLHGMAGVTTFACPSDNGMVSTLGMAMQATSMSPDVQADDNPMVVADDLSDMSKVNCVGNAVCHASIALVASRFDAPSAMPASAPASFVPTSPIRFFTGGPDRPPRSIFA